MLAPFTYLEDWLSNLEAMSTPIEKLVGEQFAPQGSPLAPVEWYILAAIKRTASQIHAFVVLVRSRNRLSASAMLRLQIDTAMRINGLFLVDDIEAAGERLMNGEHYKKLKSRSGQSMTDRFLHEQLENDLSGVSAAYNSTSAYVHLTGAPIASSIMEVGSFLFFNLDGTEPQRSEDDWATLVNSFAATTDHTRKLLAKLISTRPGPEVRVKQRREMMK